MFVLSRSLSVNSADNIVLPILGGRLCWCPIPLPDKKAGGKLSNLLKVTQQGRAGRDCPSDWQAFSACFAWEVSLGKFGAGRRVLHRKVDTAPERSMTPWQREPTGNTEEPNEADRPRTWQALPDVWPSASAQAASLLCICWPKLYQDIPSSLELLPASPLKAGAR